MWKLLTQIFGSRNQRLIKELGRTVAAVNALESSVQALADEQFPEKTRELKARFAAGTPLETLVPEAFALVREASRRKLGLRHFDVQLIGGMALHYGKIAEMRTGEGKTLMATLPAYLNALSGEGVHVVTVNDTWRSATPNGWAGCTVSSACRWASSCRQSPGREARRLCRATSLTAPTTNSASTTCATTWRSVSRTGCSASSLRHRGRSRFDPDRRGAHAADHLRPGRGEHRAVHHDQALVPRLTEQKEENGPGDYTVDEKTNRLLTEDGHESRAIAGRDGLLREGESLYDAANIRLMHHLYAALRAHALYKRDEYIVRRTAR